MLKKIRLSDSFCGSCRCDTDNGKKKSICKKYLAIVGVLTDDFLPYHKNCQITKNNYEFVIWWSHRDYDKLLNYFPEETKDLGSIWRDTGLLDENGKERPAFTTWKKRKEN